ncbi:hypothetical protein CTAYLR_002262 [Chrysophaeum taylorii]|uniref:HECT-type E3 ubiquitin transferase n=1 Tax=Chrysophaeum taylorii TaxID=2483200 RepID=A0AAD7UMZ6_9STRA|nr:hypothetical protein CTAYLR_002262 [Chrysophaeum taylorii]
MGLDAEENVFRRGARCLVPRLIGDFLLADDSRGNLFLDEGKLSLLDPSYAETSLSIEGLDDANFEALLELEGLNQTSLTEDPLAQAMGWFSPDDGTGSHGARIRSAYSKRSSLERSCELEWQLRAMRRGFERAMPLSVRRVVRPSAQDLQRIVCGAPEFTGDFRFREVFRIVMDAELRDCRPLHDALWAVIDGDDYDDSECERQHASSEATFKEAPYHFTHAQRRKLLKFITGVTRLPAKHTEFMTIELPFLPFGVDEQRRMLAMIPQSHTCDNILELPNYWEALLKTRYPQSSHDPPERGSLDSDCLENELRKLLYEKLVIAIENAEGYGLDALEPHVSAALASAAAGDDTASEVMRGVMHDDLATRRRSSSHDYMNDDDDDDGGDPNVIGASFASIPALDAESEAELSEPPSEGLLRGDASDSQCANNAGQTTLDESSNDVAMEAATLLGLDDDESPRREPGGMRSQVEVSGEQPISPDDDEIADLLREAEKHFEQSPAQDTTRARNLIDDEATPRRDDGATNVEDEDDYEFEFSFQPQSSTHEDEDDFDFDEVDLLA